MFYGFILCQYFFHKSSSLWVIIAMLRVIFIEACYQTSDGKNVLSGTEMVH